MERCHIGPQLRCTLTNKNDIKQYNLYIITYKYTYTHMLW